MTITFSPKEINLVSDSSSLKIISDDVTDFRWGKLPTQRTIDELLNYGIINLDKPANPTSHEVVSFVKKILNIPRAGHSGTLDPKVTGVLPTALGKATRILDSLLLAGKEYVCNMRLHKDVDEEKIKQIMKDYIGDIYQRPPMRASVKRVLRVRRIYNTDIIDIEGRDVLFRISCQAGTYIRKYVHDIGQSLSCGAHMKELRRTKSGPFTEDEFLSSLQNLYDAWSLYKEENEEIPLRNIILPMEYGIKHLSKIIVKDSAINPLCHGAPLGLPGVSKYSKDFDNGELIAILSLKHELVAFGETQMNAKDLEEKESGLVASVKRVLMPIGTYQSKKKDS
ncbi:MAG: RNA-guided pseudouridylation complex pseudouridine synthase subunit Cbf5 [Candidatus Thorarchaeota archaeon]